MRQKLKALLSHRDCAGAQLGVSITDGAGKKLFAFNERKNLIPASNQKLVTAACGLLQFGPGHRFATRFYRQGPVDNGTLRGSLVIRGSGAIEFTARYTDDFQRKKEILAAQLDSLAFRIRGAGIRRIGTIVVDPGPWSAVACNDHYPAAGSVTFNDNTLEVQVADKRITTVPEAVFGFELLQAQQASQEKVLENGRPTDRILINPDRDSTNYWRIDTICAEDYYRLNLIHALAQRGIALTGAAPAPPPPGGEELLFELAGIPVSEYVYRMLNDSDNLRAELLFLNLGCSRYGRAAYDNATAACTALLAAHGMLPDNATIADGSGLSRDNRISAEALTGLLRRMNGDANREAFKSSLAVAGLTGTLRDKFDAPALTGRVRAKSGSLDDVLTLSGYADTGKGEVVFSFMANKVKDKRKIWKLYQDLLLCLLAAG